MRGAAARNGGAALVSARAEADREEAELRAGREDRDDLSKAARLSYHAFGLTGTALSKKIRVFQSSSLKAVAIRPNAS